jgi:hypothetical protein
VYLPQPRLCLVVLESYTVYVSAPLIVLHMIYNAWLSSALLGRLSGLYNEDGVSSSSEPGLGPSADLSPFVPMPLGARGKATADDNHEQTGDWISELDDENLLPPGNIESPVPVAFETAHICVHILHAALSHSHDHMIWFLLLNLI